MFWPALAIVFGLALGAAWYYWRQHQAEAKRELAARETRVAELEEQQRLIREQARDQQQALFNSMVEGVLFVDRDGRIQSANSSLEQLFGLTTDIRGQTILEALRTHELSELAARLLRDGTVSGLELNLAGLNSRCLEVNAATVLNQTGERQGAIFVFHDLTRIKQLENTRQEFVANVSHELRTPLSLIKGFVETLLDGAKNDPEVATRFLQTIEKHTDRLTYLIEDLLTISRLESGQIVLNLQSVDLRAAAGQVIADLSSRAKAKSVTLENHVPAGLSARADSDRLQQVFFNLIDNAIKYGREGGRVEVMGAAFADWQVELRVTDDGAGIPPEAQERVFERFYRVDRARSRDTGGTGLGLAIVKHIVQSHHGEVSVTSVPGEGTSFLFRLPEK
ncbi:MAG: PAS domain S-box protein [Verrucomicrobia bacterium]|nr:PAS domain S-box protein [Verrucomicrobiota bacterium]